MRVGRQIVGALCTAVVMVSSVVGVLVCLRVEGGRWVEGGKCVEGARGREGRWCHVAQPACRSRWRGLDIRRMQPRKQRVGSCRAAVGQL